MKFTKRQIWFVITFAAIGLIAQQIPLWRLEGSKAAFTVFDLFGPLASAFIGTWAGIIAVFAVQIANFFLHGAQILDAGTIIRFFPMLFAVWYFNARGRAVLIVPLVAMAGFVAHPVGRTVWYFALYWTIPLFCHVLRNRFLFARALGATFTAHAVGGALWIYVFKMPAAVWVGLIPVVARERLIFAAGIALSYFIVNNILHILERRFSIRLHWHIDSAYVLKSLR